jgi:hypothetical protein
MSGLDEREKLWILQYKEWYGEDWIYCYRGLYATSYDDAVRKAGIWLKYCNYNYGENDDGDDYVFESLFLLTKNLKHGFLLHEDILLYMQENNENYERERED